MSIFNEIATELGEQREAWRIANESYQAERNRVVSALQLMMNEEYEHVMPFLPLGTVVSADRLSIATDRVSTTIMVLSCNPAANSAKVAHEYRNCGVTLVVEQKHQSGKLLACESFKSLTSHDGVTFSPARINSQRHLDLSPDVEIRKLPFDRTDVISKAMEKSNLFDNTQPRDVLKSYLRLVIRELDQDSLKISLPIAIPAAVENKLTIAGHSFVLTGRPGAEGGRIESTWNFPEFAEDGDASDEPSPEEIVACDVIEAQILALYCSGALMKDYAFNPEVVKALETSIDAMTGILDRHARDEAPSSFDRPR